MGGLHQHGTWRLHSKLLNLGKTFFRTSRAWNIAKTKSHSWRGFLYIYILSFPRFWTFCIEWFAFLFLISWQWKRRICPARSRSNFRKSNPIELQSCNWLRLGSVIELNRTHPKLLLIEHNRTLKQSNIIEHCMQQSIIKPVSSGFKQKALSSNKLCIGFSFKHEYAKMSQRADRKKQTVLETRMVKGYHECPLSPSVSVITLLLRRKGEI